MRNIGEADYQFDVPRTGWYELWVEATGWNTDLFLDGEFLIHTAFASGVWEQRDKAEKVLNLHLAQGRHTLRFSRPYHPGLPYLRRFCLDPATDVTGKVRVRLGTDRLCFRQGEAFPVRLTAGKEAQEYALSLKLTAAETGAPVTTVQRRVPAGEGVFEKEVALPTDREGAFDVTVTDAQGRPVDRVIQYLVVDTAHRPEAPATLGKELVQEIDCAHQQPDYASSETRVVEAPFGAYVESGTKGRVGYNLQADWFAYTLHVPEAQQPYVAEIDYPDDDERTFIIALAEEALNPRCPTQGLASGGQYSLSQSMQKHEFYFFPRQHDPRLVFQNWYTGQRAAAARIRVYRIASGFPAVRFGADGRRYGMYQEEPLRFTSYFGAAPEGNTWSNLWRCAERFGQLSNFVGANFWHPTIAVYQSRLWPGTSIPGYQIADEDGWGVIGPTTAKEPVEKDILRLMLLACEKYGMTFVGELHMPPNDILMRTLDQRFGGTGDLGDDGPQKPWLAVSKDGECGAKSAYKPYYNALYPGVQDWVASVVQELAERYKDSPAFKGAAIRLMGWTFGGWQTLPSIQWGYGEIEGLTPLGRATFLSRSRSVGRARLPPSRFCTLWRLGGSLALPGFRLSKYALSEP